MNARVRVIIEKEWAELIRRRSMILLMTVLPASLLAVAIAAALVIPAIMENRQAFEEPDLLRHFATVRKHAPDLADLELKTVLQVMLLRQILLLHLLVPLMVAVTVAAYGIVGEKINRSLEPLLATPITTTELLLGKSLAAVIPGTALAWVMFGLFTLSVAIFAPPGVFGQVLNAVALCIILLLCPLVGLLGLSVVLISSARSSDPRSAQQIATVVVVPLMCIIAGQMGGLFLLTPLMALGSAVVVAVVACLVLKAGVALFERETILTRWK